MPFHDIYWYSGWIMNSTRTKCRHLPERVMRQYGSIQGIPIPLMLEQNMFKKCLLSFDDNKVLKDQLDMLIFVHVCKTID